jgi:hypothetical protein
MGGCFSLPNVDIIENLDNNDDGVSLDLTTTGINIIANRSKKHIRKIE